MGCTRGGVGRVVPVQQVWYSWHGPVQPLILQSGTVFSIKSYRAPAGGSVSESIRFSEVLEV